jgi:hypothetical protein
MPAILVLLCLAARVPAVAQYEAPAQQIPTFDASPLPTQPSLSPTPPPQLRGLAEFTTISAQGLEVRKQLFPKCRMAGFTCMKVSVKNNASVMVVVNGDQAQADIAGNTVGAASEVTLTQRAGCGMTAEEIALLWGVGVGTLGLAGPILQEILADEKYPKEAFGKDAVRQRIQGQRLGRRFILPGDETTGWLCFPAPPGATLGEVLVPVSSATESGRVAVRLTAAQADTRDGQPRK